jgi:hypothetical protein
MVGAMTDPWANRIEKMTPAEYARYLVEKAAADDKAAAVRIHMEDRSDFLERAAACEAWLLNGVTALTVRQIDQVLEVLVVPDPNSPVDPLETEVDRRKRTIHIRGLRAELLLAKNKR